MKTLIIPCVGSEKIDSLPLILCRHPKDGNLLAKKVLSGIFPESYDRLIYAVTAEDECKYSVSQAVELNIPSAEVIVFNEKTSGSADTVYRTILKAGVTGEVAVKDSHGSISLGEPIEGNAIAGLDLMQCDYAVRNLRNKSFIVINEQGNVCDIVEKRLRSDVISVGLYSFRNAKDFMSAFLRLSDPDYAAGRLYVSHVISYLIGRRDFVFHCSKVKSLEEWGNLESWRELRRDSLHIIGADIKLIMTDLDGTLFNTTMVNYLAYKEAIQKFGYELSYDYFYKFCNGRYYKHFLSELFPEITEDLMHEIHTSKKALYKKYISEAKLNVPLMRLLDICRRECKLALVTTASLENTHDILHAFGLMNYFDLVLTHEDISNVKPDPEGYIKAMAFFRVSPQECVIFEDSDTGIEAAMRSGAQYFKVLGI